VAEQDANATWVQVGDAVRELTATEPVAAADVVALGVCSQYSSIVPVDAGGRAIGPMILYWDHRGTARSHAIMQRHPEALAVYLEHHGIPPMGGGLSLGHILSFQHDQPDVHAATAAYLELMDFVTARLTGRISATQCTMFMAQVCDNRTVGVTGYDPELVRLSGVDPSKLPPLVEIDGVVGELLPEVAAELGLPAGVVVRAAMNDSQAGALASGVFAPGRGGLAIGTTAVLLDTVDGKRTDLDAELVSMPSPIPGRYLAMAENGIAGKAVEHVLTNVLCADDVLGTSGDPFGALDVALAASPPGSNGVIFLPWLTGSMAPSASSKMRGAFLNLSLDTSRVDAVRAMIEGTAHNLRWLLPSVEAFTGHRIEEIAFFGGAARSAAWAQVLADVLDRPVRPLDRPDRAVARAVALVAARGAGSSGSIPTRGEYEPRPQYQSRYDAMHEQFVAAFDALLPISRSLNAPPASDQNAS
jgi:xylulokinase